MSSIPTPPVVPPMSARVRESLYGIFAWLALIFAAALVVMGSLSGFGVDVPRAVGVSVAVGQTLVATVWGWLGFVAKDNVVTVRNRVEDGA